MSQQIYSEDTGQKVLAALRELTDKSTLREVNGRMVADIVPPPGRWRWSLNRAVSELLDLPMGTVGHYVGILSSKGFVQRGEGTRVMRRWVAMDD